MSTPWSRRRGPMVVVACLVAALAVGCSTTTWETSGIDHPTTTTAKHYPNTTAGLTASITDHLSTVGPDINQWAPSRTEAKCAAVKIVARLGLNRLLDLGYQTQTGGLALPYSDDERTAVKNILVGCIDFQSGLFSLISAYGKLDIGAAQCLTDGIGRQGLTQAFASAYLAGDQPDPFAANNLLGAGMGSLMAQCLTPASDLVPGSPLVRFPSNGTATSTTGPGGATTSTTAPAAATTTSTTAPS